MSDVLTSHSASDVAASVQLAGRSEKRELYERHVNQAWADQQASSDSFDNNLLTFSSAALGLSLAFIKDIVPLSKAGWLGWLFFSWFSFGGCILVTIMSFLFGIFAQKTQVRYLHKYYIERQDEYFDKKSVWSRSITFCSIAGSVLFFSGLVSTVVFVCENVSHIKEPITCPTKIMPISLHTR